MENANGFISGNLIIDLSFVAWFVAQFIKLIIELTVHQQLDVTKMWSSGGMPSSHSSCVCSAAAAIGMLHGSDSSIFALATIFAGVVMYDACHVRRSAGEQARMINLLAKNWQELYPTMKSLQLKEILGHTPLQVLAGAVLGIAIGCYGVMYFTT